ncbi:MAG: THUMP domain-containing protein [Burkholderiales bacterium]|jgi:putative N6-adenine-specific DNA methylase|nr:THUMP domain-containing protein [Burkholderiales bacterium]
MDDNYFFATCPRGLEKALTQELKSLGAASLSPTEGGVAFKGDLTLMYRANLESRLASRILWRVEKNTYRDEHDIYALAEYINWTKFFNETRSLRVDTTAIKSPLTSLSFVTLRVKDAICDRFRREGMLRPAIDKQAPDVRVLVYLTDREVSLYLDTSGDTLFKRGYRRNTEEPATLRENLAAGLIALAGWTPGTPFIDPFCGSGTLAIEAALIASNSAPGLTRAFGFQKLRFYDGPTWQRLRQTARDRVLPAPKAPSIFASDRSTVSIAGAKTHAALARVSEWIDFKIADATHIVAPADQGILLSNPPYGLRLDDEKYLTELYPALASALKKNFAGWSTYFITADREMPHHMGLKPSKKTPLYNGAIECRFFEFRIVKGSMRRVKKTDGDDMADSTHPTFSDTVSDLPPTVTDSWGMPKFPKISGLPPILSGAKKSVEAREKTSSRHADDKKPASPTRQPSFGKSSRFSEKSERGERSSTPRMARSGGFTRDFSKTTRGDGDRPPNASSATDKPRYRTKTPSFSHDAPVKRSSASSFDEAKSSPSKAPWAKSTTHHVHKDSTGRFSKPAAAGASQKNATHKTQATKSPPHKPLAAQPLPVKPPRKVLTLKTPVKKQETDDPEISYL